MINNKGKTYTHKNLIISTLCVVLLFFSCKKKVVESIKPVEADYPKADVVNGGANAKTVEAGFRIILKDPNVKAILINIFGGIVRCDRVANGVVEAYKAIGEIPVPIIVRLQGTNAAEGAKIINDSGLKVYSAIVLKEAAELVEKVLKD